MPEVQSEIRRVSGDPSNDPEWCKHTEKKTWLTGLEGRQRQIETEKDIGTEVPAKVNINDDVVIVGRVDRLTEDVDGVVRIVDIKIGKTAPSGREVEGHAQLATYQLALSKRKFAESRDGLAVNSGESIEQPGTHLVFLRESHNKTTITSHEQLELTEDEPTDWERYVEQVARVAFGPRIPVLAGNHRKSCTSPRACPAAEGN